MSILSSGARSNLARAGVTAAVAIAAIGGFAGTAQAANPTMVLSATTGPAAGGNTITMTIPSTATTKFSSGNIGVAFFGSSTAPTATAVCPSTTATSNVTSGAVTSSASVTATAGTVVQNSSGNVRYLSTVKASVAVPALYQQTWAAGTATVSTNLGPTYWLVCAYNKPAAVNSIASAATLIGKATYVVAAAPLIADGTDHSGDTPAGPDWSTGGGTGGTDPINAISPASGPAIGGQTVTIYGANFPTTISATTPLTATLGGVALTGITAGSSTYFTAVTPAHAASATAVPLTVTTNGGTVSASTVFTYKNGITVSPATAVSGTSVDLDIQGVGFNDLTFVAADTSGVDSGDGDAVGTNSNTPHVYLVQGVYDESAYGAGANKTKGQATECINPVIISDIELICTLDAASSIDSTTAAGTYDYKTANLANGTYTVTVVDKGKAAPTFQSELSSGATFTVSDF